MKLKRRRRRIHLSEQAVVAVRCACVLMLIVASGTLGFMCIEEGWGLWKSLFFTLITITTVGYGDEGLSFQGEIFATVLLLFGIGTATYSLSSFVKLAVSYQSAWKKKMQKKIDQLQDHFVICGYGRLAITVCNELQMADIPFVVIDHDQHRFDEAVEQGFLAACGNSAEDAILEQAGVSRAQGVICAIGSDAENVFAILSVREINPNAFIASRASTERAARRMKRAGASLVVSPYTTAGLNIADAILRPKLSEYLRMSRTKQSNLELMEFTIHENSSLVGNRIKDVGRYFSHVVFVAINREKENQRVRPGGDETFRAGDTVTIAGNPNDLEMIYQRSESNQPWQENLGNVTTTTTSVPLTRISSEQDQEEADDYSANAETTGLESPV